MPEPDLTHLGMRLEKLLPQIIQAIFTHGDDQINIMPVAQLRMVRQLEDGPKTPSTLAHALGLTPGAISQLIVRMKAAGLIEEVTDELDRRVKRVSLSHKGQSMMHERSTRRAFEAARLLETMTKEEIEHIFQALEKLKFAALEFRDGHIRDA